MSPKVPFASISMSTFQITRSQGDYETYISRALHGCKFIFFASYFSILNKSRYSSIPQSVVEETIFDPVYSLSIPSVSNPSYSLIHAATLFMSLAIASCLDLRNSSIEDYTTSHQNAARYHQLARAALSSEKSMLEHPSLPTIRVLVIKLAFSLI